MTRVLDARGSGSGTASAGHSWTAPRDPVRAGRRAGRAQRCRQDHAFASRRRPARADVGHHHGARSETGRRPRPAGRVGFVAQDTPMYAGLSVADHLRLGARMNPAGTRHWPGIGSPSSASTAGRRPGALRRAARPARPHPGGRQAPGPADPRRAGRQPRPAGPPRVPAGADGVRRRTGVSVVLSSHLVADLERVCDYLVVLVDSRVHVAGDVDDLLATHRRLTGPRRDPASMPPTRRSSRPATPTAEHVARAHRGSDPRSRLDRGGGQPRRPRPRLHGPRQTPDLGHARGWGRSVIRLLVAPVPYAGVHRRSRSARRRHILLVTGPHLASIYDTP